MPNPTRFFLLRLLVVMAVLRIGACAYGATPFGDNAYRVTQYTVHDGDTLTGATVELDFGAALVRQSIRFHDFDAWEITAQRQTVDVTDEEKAKGRAARDALAELLAGGEVWIRPTGNGFSVYGRLEAEVWLVPKGSAVSGQRSAGGKPLDVGTWMKARGHARKAESEKRKSE